MPAKVFIYTLSTCSHCKRVKQFLADNQVPYDYVDVDLSTGEERQSLVDKVKEHNPRCTFPTVLIGDQVIVGFREDELKKALELG